MERELIDNFFIVLATVVQVLSILMLWSFVIENKKNILVGSYQIYKKYSNMLFTMSLICLFILWLCTEGGSKLVFIILLCATVVWFFSAVAFFVNSIKPKLVSQIRADIRNASMSAVWKMFIVGIVTWMINI